MPPKGRGGGKTATTSKAKLREEVVQEAAALREDFDMRDVFKLYRLNQQACCLHDISPPRSQNCRTNPYCIHRLGQEKWEKLMKSAEADFAKAKKNMQPRDQRNTPCGLTNAGNFCYVNSFLQIFFNDPPFRQIVYDWVPIAGWLPPDGQKMNVQSVMDALQSIFLTLEFTPYEDCTPEKLTEALRLDNEQQDAQEFTLLLLDALTRHLPAHPNGAKLVERIRQLTAGKMYQRLDCECGRSSRRDLPLAPLQLGIAGLKTLTAVIKNYLAPETMEDFRCDECGERGKVTRKIEIVELPSILLLQLNRYSYDADHRKKIQTALQFPRELPVDALLSEEALKKRGANEPEVYELSAVMVHEGENAHFGHFYDIVRHPYNKTWFKYNDEHVTEAKPPGVERERDTGASKPSADLKECYGLVYRRPEDLRLKYPSSEIKDPIIKEMNDKFNALVSGENKRTQEGAAERQRRREALENLFKQLEAGDDKLKSKDMVKKAREIAFLPTELLQDIISAELQLVEEKMEKAKEDTETAVLPCSSTQQSDESSQGRDNRRRQCKSRYVTVAERGEVGEKLQPVYMPLCQHGHISLDSVLNGTVKAVMKSAAETLLKKYGLYVRQQSGGSSQKLCNGDITPSSSQLADGKLKTGEDICKECVAQYRFEANFKERVDKDQAWATQISKDQKRCSMNRAGYDDHSMYEYYVSKKDLMQFKRLAQREQEFQLKLRGDPPLLVFAFTDVENGKEGPSSASSSPVKRGVSKRKQRVEEDAEKPPAKKSSSNEHEEGQEVSEVMDELVDRVDLLSSTEDAIEDSKDLKPLNGGEKEENGVKKRNGRGRETTPEVEMKEVNGRERSETPDSSMPDEKINGRVELPEGQICFNDELKCHHGNVNWLSHRSGVSAEEWERLTKGYFTHVFVVPVHPETVCAECAKEKEMEELDQKKVQRQLESVKEQFADLVRVAERRKVDDGRGPYTHAVCSRFIAALKTELKSGTKIPPVCQNCTFCEHGRPVLRVASSADVDNESMRVGGQRGTAQALKAAPRLLPLKTKEWSLITDCYPETTPDHIPVPIMLRNGEVDDLCIACWEARRAADDNKRFSYEKADIFIRIGDEPSATATTSAASADKPSPSRGSFALTRRATAKNLIKIKMSSNQTVRKLKEELYERTRQSPNDQLIYLYEGGPVLENEQTLGSARVRAHNEDSPLVLIVQSAQPMEVDEKRRPEKGFTDTALAF